MPNLKPLLNEQNNRYFAAMRNYYVEDFQVMPMIPLHSIMSDKLHKELKDKYSNTPQYHWLDMLQCNFLMWSDDGKKYFIVDTDIDTSYTVEQIAFKKSLITLMAIEYHHINLLSDFLMYYDAHHYDELLK